MADINTQIRNVIDEFVGELNALVRHAALEAVAGALGGAPAALGVAPRRGRPPKAPPVAVAQATRRPGAKRSPEALAELTETLFQYISGNPGQGIEAIGKGMGIETKELTLPVKKLIADGRIATEGQKRATKYFPGGAPAKAAKAAKASRKRRPRKK